MQESLSILPRSQLKVHVGQITALSCMTRAQLDSSTVMHEIARTGLSIDCDGYLLRECGISSRSISIRTEVAKHSRCARD